MTDYITDIIEILQKAPEGLPIRVIVRHVYNKNNTLFSSVSLDDVKHSVTVSLTRCAQRRDSGIQRTEQRGVYRLTPQRYQELTLDFADYEDVDDNEESSHTEGSIVEEPSLGLPFC